MNVQVLADDLGLAGLVMTGPKSVTVTETAQYVATASYVDGSTASVTSGAVWSILNGRLATITQTGVLTALATGTVTIRAVYGGLTTELSVAVLVDPSWVSVNPGTNIQSIVNSYQGTTTFYLRAGTHVQQRVVPKSGNRFIGEAGAILDGQNVTDYAFYSNNLAQSNVTIQGLEIKNYTTPLSSFGAISGENVTDWIVTDNLVHHNAKVGVRVGAGTGWQVLRNIVHTNGVLGINGYRCHGALIADNETYNNNPTNVIEPGLTAAAAGIKILQSQNLVIRGNKSHNNFGKGIWSDTNYPTTLIENNTVTNNRDVGIWHEISYAGVIRNNTVTGNGHGTASGSLNGAGISVTNSSNVEIYNNTVVDNRHGLTAMWWTSGYPTTGLYGAYSLSNVNFHDNIVQMLVGRTGMATDAGGASSIYSSQNNRFTRNTYRLMNITSQWFQWQGIYKTWSQWQAVGNDATGTISLIP